MCVIKGFREYLIKYQPDTTNVEFKFDISKLADFHIGSSDQLELYLSDFSYLKVLRVESRFALARTYKLGEHINLRKLSVKLFEVSRSVDISNLPTLEDLELVNGVEKIYVIITVHLTTIPKRLKRIVLKNVDVVFDNYKKIDLADFRETIETMYYDCEQSFIPISKDITFSNFPKLKDLKIDCRGSLYYVIKDIKVNTLKVFGGTKVDWNSVEITNS